MNADSFSLEIVTPRHLSIWDIRSLRLKDETGFFGIMPGHCDFLTVLVPSLGHFIAADGGEHFLAVDGGIFMMRSGQANITSGEVFESLDAVQLAKLIENALTRRDAAEQAIAKIVAGIERSFLEKTTALSRGRP